MTPRRRKTRKSRGKRLATPRIVLLGPQIGEPTLPRACEDLREEGRLSAKDSIGAITAGWQEREGELDRLATDVGCPVVDLGLYGRAEAVVEADPELAAAHRETQRKLKELRRAYNVRLERAMTSWADIGRLAGDAAVLDPERADALEEIRRLDARHLERIAEIRSAYEEAFRPSERDAVVRHREELADVLDGIGVVAIAGGHIATLLNRMRLFGIGEMLEERAVVAWSAGAMALGSRVVLFHDSPPWGPGNAEVFDRGLGRLGDLIPFPHASRRLALEDAVRTSRLARRFAPSACVLLDPGARLDRVADGWTGTDVDRLAADGARRALEAVAA